MTDNDFDTCDDYDGDDGSDNCVEGSSSNMIIADEGDDDDHDDQPEPINIGVGLALVLISKGVQGGDIHTRHL